jgi:hypothetical protein
VKTQEPIPSPFRRLVASTERLKRAHARAIALNRCWLSQHSVWRLAELRQSQCAVRGMCQVAARRVAAQAYEELEGLTAECQAADALLEMAKCARDRHSRDVFEPQTRPVAS